MPLYQLSNQQLPEALTLYKAYQLLEEAGHLTYLYQKSPDDNWPEADVPVVQRL